MRTELIEYLEEQFEVSGFYHPPTENRDTGEQFGAGFEIEDIIWMQASEKNIAIYIDVSSIMNDTAYEKISEIVLTKINEDE